MIRRVTITNFKRFSHQRFDLADSVILAGPNNAGKSTLLQAIVTWKLGLDRWIAQRKGAKSEDLAKAPGSQPGRRRYTRKGEALKTGMSSAVKRSGVSITRADFTAVPVREMNLLWEDRRVSGDGGRPGTPRLIEIVLEGEDADHISWTCGLEFQYANPELVYACPRDAKNLPQEAIQGFPPDAAASLDIVHVPPLSGIERDHPRRDRGMQDLLVGQGRPGEILRNLLLAIAEKRREDWESLVRQMRDLFQIELTEPSYSPAQPFIVCEYREPRHERPLDLANAGLLT
jgi:hypothetical protein